MVKSFSLGWCSDSSYENLTQTWATGNLSCTVFNSYISGRTCLHKCIYDNTKENLKIMGSDHPWKFCRFLTTCTGCFREGQTAAPRAGENTTTFTGSPGCSSCWIPQQSQPWVSELGSFHSSSPGVMQVSQVLPLSVHKLVLAVILVLCSAALVPEMARRRIRSAHLRMLGKENIGILWYKAFLLFLSHFSISVHLHRVHRIASLSQ